MWRLQTPCEQFVAIDSYFLREYCPHHLRHRRRRYRQRCCSTRPSPVRRSLARSALIGGSELDRRSSAGTDSTLWRWGAGHQDRCAAARRAGALALPHGSVKQAWSQMAHVQLNFFKSISLFSCEIWAYNQELLSPRNACTTFNLNIFQLDSD